MNKENISYVCIIICALVALAIVSLILFIVSLLFVLVWGIWYAELLEEYLSVMVSFL